MESLPVGVYGVLRLGNEENKIEFPIGEQMGDLGNRENACLPPSVSIPDQTTNRSLVSLGEALVSARHRSDEVFSVAVDSMREAELQNKAASPGSRRGASQVSRTKGGLVAPKNEDDMSAEPKEIVFDGVGGAVGAALAAQEAKKNQLVIDRMEAETMQENDGSGEQNAVEIGLKKIRRL